MHSPGDSRRTHRDTPSLAPYDPTAPVQPQTSDSHNLGRYPGQPQPQTDPRMLAILDSLNGGSRGAPSTHDSGFHLPSWRATGTRRASLDNLSHKLRDSRTDTHTHRITDGPRRAQPPGDTGRSSDVHAAHTAPETAPGPQTALSSAVSWTAADLTRIISRGIIRSSRTPTVSHRD